MNNALYDTYKHRKVDLLKMIFKAAKYKNYAIFYKNTAYPVNINFWGIRSTDKDTKKYNDLIVVFNEEDTLKEDVCCIDKKYWTIKIYEATTTPSCNYLLQPLNPNGTAILTSGQHRGLWKIGYHKGKYLALVQAKPVTVIRDNNKDDKLDFDNQTETGMFGINCHHAGNIITDFIGLYSAGCQVLKNTKLFNDEFLPYIMKSLKDEKDTISYTLISQADLFNT